MALLREASAAGRACILFPSSDALSVPDIIASPYACAASDPTTPWTVLLLDGSWSNAKSLNKRLQKHLGAVATLSPTAEAAAPASSEPVAPVAKKCRVESDPSAVPEAAAPVVASVPIVVPRVKLAPGNRVQMGGLRKLKQETDKVRICGVATEVTCAWRAGQHSWSAAVLAA